MSKRASGEWVYGVTWIAATQRFEPYKAYLPLGYSQSHWRKIIKERQRQ